jgi:hypothetical protein
MNAKQRVKPEMSCSSEVHTSPETEKKTIFYLRSSVHRMKASSTKNFPGEYMYKDDIQSPMDVDRV